MINRTVKLLSFAGILFLIHDSTHAAVVRCFNRMKAKTGSFKSPLYPFRYRPNQFCEYVIRAEPDYYIEITFTKFRLEQPFQGEKTDYIQILDGGKNNRQRELTYDGSQRGGFTYTSLTSRVFINFHSDAQFEYNGFYATYRMIRRECAVPEVQNGEAKCDVNSNGQARSCEIECDHTYIAGGDSNIFCQGTQFNKPPICIPDPSEHCDMSEVQHLGPLDCKEDPDTRLMTCTYECPPLFLPPENKEIICIEGIWDRVPSRCKPRPTVDCLLSEVEDFAGECERDPVTNVTTSCGFVCENPFYIAVNDLVCSNGTWGERNCVPNPEIMDMCLNGSLLIKDVKVNPEDDGDEEDEEEEVAECPFTAEEQASYRKAFFDDLEDLQELPGRARGSGIKRYRCHEKFCWVRQPHKTPYINCYQHSQRFPKNRKRREAICLQCRVKKCSRPAVFFT